MLILSFGCLRFLRESCLLYAFLLGYLPSIFLRFFMETYWLLFAGLLKKFVLFAMKYISLLVVLIISINYFSVYWLLASCRKVSSFFCLVWRVTDSAAKIVTFMLLRKKRCQPGCLPGWHLCLTELSIVYTFSVQIAAKNEKYFIAKA